MERGTSIKVFGLCSALIPLGLSWAAAEQAKRSRIVFFGKGDGEQLMAPDEICGFCLANRTDMPYTDLRPRWRATEIGTTVAFKERLKRPLHPLADAPFFTFWLDIMHLWDCKGVWPLLMGGALWMLVQLMGVANGERWTWRAGGGHLHLPGFIGPAVPVEDLPHWVMIVHEKHFDQLRNMQDGNKDDIKFKHCVRLGKGEECLGTDVHNIHRHLLRCFKDFRFVQLIEDLPVSVVFADGIHL